MRTEKHIVNKTYGGHQLARYVDVYEVTTDGCSSSPMSGYKGTEATLIDQPAWNEKFSSWSLTGATATGNNYVINNDVTAKANYETAKNVTLETDGHGTISASPISGFSGTIVTLSNTPDSGYAFSSYDITGATLTGNQFILNNDVTAHANFYDPLNPYGLPPYTLRLLFKDNVTPTFSKGTARQVSSSPNIWDLTYEDTSWASLLQYNNDLLEIMGFGDISNIESMGDMCWGCRSLRAVPLFNTLEHIDDVSYMFRGCYAVESGALALYQQLSTQTNPPRYHVGTFKNCGSDTVAGAAELAQIPDDWKS